MAIKKVVFLDEFGHYIRKADEKYVSKVNGKDLSANDFTDTAQSKLNGIESGAQVNKIETVKLNNTALAISNKTVNIDLSAYETIAGANGKYLPKDGHITLTETQKTELKGDAGKGISSSTIKYCVSNSGTIVPSATSSWTATIPVSSAGQYLWTKVTLTYTDGNTLTYHSVSRNGTNGLDGAPGAKGEDGVYKGIVEHQKEASDVSVSLNPNEVYKFPEMKSLTISLGAETSMYDEYAFSFDSGRKATTLTLPSSVILPDGFSIDPLQSYEINIANNRLLSASWEHKAADGWDYVWEADVNDSTTNLEGKISSVSITSKDSEGVYFVSSNPLKFDNGDATIEVCVKIPSNLKSTSNQIKIKSDASHANKVFTSSDGTGLTLRASSDQTFACPHNQYITIRFQCKNGQTYVYVNDELKASGTQLNDSYTTYTGIDFPSTSPQILWKSIKYRKE